MAVVRTPSTATPRDAHCEVSEEPVGHPVRVPRARLVPRRGGPVRDDAPDGAPGRGAPWPAAGGAATPSEDDRSAWRPDRRARPGDRRPDQRQAPPAHLPGRWVHGLGPSPAPGGRHGQGRLAARPPRVPALAAGAWRAPRHRLGQRGRPPRLLRGPALEPLALRPVRPRREPGDDPRDARRVLRDAWRRARGRARRPDGLPQGRRCRERRRAGARLPRVRFPLWLPARLLRGRRPGIEGRRRAPRGVRQGRPPGPRGRRSPTSRRPTRRRSPGAPR